MTAATADRQTPAFNGPERILGPIALASGVTIYNGILVAKDTTGKMRAATDGAARVVWGVSQHKAVEADGDELVVARGVFPFTNSGSSALAAGDIGAWCYVEDDNIVRKAPGTYGRRAGIFEGFDGTQCLVRVGDPQYQSDAYSVGPITSGAIDPDIRYHNLSTTGTVAYSLAAGSFIGQLVTCFWTVAAATPVGVITPAAVAGYATVTGNTFGDHVEFRWNGSAWHINSQNGCVIA